MIIGPVDIAGQWSNSKNYGSRREVFSCKLIVHHKEGASERGNKDIIDESSKSKSEEKYNLQEVLVKRDQNGEIQHSLDNSLMTIDANDDHPCKARGFRPFQQRSP